MYKEYGNIDDFEDLKNEHMKLRSNHGALEMKFEILLQQLAEQDITTDIEIEDLFQKHIEDA